MSSRNRKGLLRQCTGGRLHLPVRHGHIQLADKEMLSNPSAIGAHTILVSASATDKTEPAAGLAKAAWGAWPREVAIPFRHDSRGYYTTIAQRQLNFTLTLLASDFTGYWNGLLYWLTNLCRQQLPAEVRGGYIHLIWKFRMKHFHNGVLRSCQPCRFRRRTEHLIYCQIERTYPIGLFKGKTGVSGCFTYGIHRRTFAISNFCTCSIADSSISNPIRS